MNDAAKVRPDVRQGRRGVTRSPRCAGCSRPLASAPQAVMEEFSDVVLAYGHSDEFSLVLRKQSSLYERRARCETGAARWPRRVAHASLARARSKLTSVLVSLFTATYVMRWGEHFPDTPLQRAPAFDARAVRCPVSVSLGRCSF